MVRCALPNRSFSDAQLIGYPLGRGLWLFAISLSALAERIEDGERKLHIVTGDSSPCTRVIYIHTYRMMEPWIRKLTSKYSWSAVARGAAHGIHISSRKARRHYGTRSDTVFVHGKHPIENLEICEFTGRRLCTNFMNWFINYVRISEMGKRKIASNIY